MRDHMVATVAAVAAFVLLGGSALAQESTATVRTYHGAAYRIFDPSLELFYTIGEPKGMEGGATQEAGQRFGSTINISTSGGASPGGDQPVAAGAGEAPKLLRGHSTANSITLSSLDVTTVIPWDQIRTLRFERQPVPPGGIRFPSYIPHYKYSASVALTSGEKVEAGSVNLGGAIVRGTGPTGRVEIPWQEVEYIVFDR
jgi:hypothetical protein